MFASLPRARTQRWLGTVCAVILVSGIAGGCSGERDGYAGPGPTASDGATQAAPQTDAGDGAGDGSADGVEGDSADGGEEGAATCDQLHDAWTAASRYLVALDANHPATFVRSFAQAAQALKPIVPPQAIAGPWTTMTTYLSDVNHGLSSANTADAGAVASAFERAVNSRRTHDAANAAENINTYLTNDCRVISPAP